ncbi:MAG: tRNA (adenosine(37)-N6)-dimethylallyltransferase MiaA [Chloroflexi bacterium HGW-Chloroflexi-8]|jgi:tRNA dimethylallyltransferase|nr:MAG: tRNA (adenosine(37)-N6)-dimethylallyltransferase MiaA [Chloroflexi bacterium HGW-Chloroflexi-8]
MSWNDYPKPLLVIVGPTAAGKTKLSIELARVLDGEIISADSRYFYRGMDIGTAKPTYDERKSVQHHLIDIADPNETWSLAKFQNEAKIIINEIQERDHLPILVGGTGQYIQAVVQSWSMPAQERNDNLRSVLENKVKSKEKDNLYEFLKIVDPEAAAHIDFRNFRRTLRAVEVILLTGKRFSDQRKISSSPFSRKIIGINLDRTQLYARIDYRIEEMFKNGFVDEVRNLVEQGYSSDLSSMTAIGYREICNYLRNEISLDEAKVIMKRNTRQYVRRQANWFKENDPHIHWFLSNKMDFNQLIDYIQSDKGWQLPDKE